MTTLSAHSRLQEMLHDPDNEFISWDRENADQLLAEHNALLAERQWQPLDTMPMEEEISFDVLWENDFNAMVAIQVSWFEGGLYPDALGGNIDIDDRVIGYTQWRPSKLPLPPTEPR